VKSVVNSCSALGIYHLPLIFCVIFMHYHTELGPFQLHKNCDKFKDIISSIFLYAAVEMSK
jgi:hypothetical protein